MKMVLKANNKTSVKRFYVDEFSFMVKCPLCGGEHEIDDDMLLYPSIGCSDTFGRGCPVKEEEWDAASDDERPEIWHEFEVPYKVISINVEIEIGEPKET